MPTPIYPSLSSHAGALTDPKEVIPSILRHMFATPTSSSDYFENRSHNYKLSFRDLESRYGNDPETFMKVYKEKLSDVIQRYFPTTSFNIATYYQVISELTGELEDPNDGNEQYPRYTVFLDIQRRLADGSLEPVIMSHKVRINKETHEFEIDFEGAPA